MSDRKYLTTKDVAEKLEVKEVTVRKYSSELESKGYTFEKNKSNWRLFRNEDMQALSYLQALQSQGKTLAESAHKVAELQQSGLSYRQPDITIQSEPSQDDMKSFFKQQENFNKELINRLEKQQEYINEQLEKRDQQLMNVLKEMQEQKKLELEQNNKRWWEFWR